MTSKCPSCQNGITLDISQLKNVILKFECPSCSKRLSLSSNDTSMKEVEDQERQDRIDSLVQLALTDGKVSDDEMQFIMAQAKALGVQEMIVKEAINKHSKTNDFDDSVQFIEEYSEDKQNYKNEHIYDWLPFTKIISGLKPNNPNLKRYRDDLVEMVSFNAQKYKELARSWENLYQ